MPKVKEGMTKEQAKEIRNYIFEYFCERHYSIDNYSAKDIKQALQVLTQPEDRELGKEVKEALKYVKKILDLGDIKVCVGWRKKTHKALATIEQSLTQPREVGGEVEKAIRQVREGIKYIDVPPLKIKVGKALATIEQALKSAETTKQEDREVGKEVKEAIEIIDTLLPTEQLDNGKYTHMGDDFCKIKRALTTVGNVEMSQELKDSLIRISAIGLLIDEDVRSVFDYDVGLVKKALSQGTERSSKL